MCLILVISAIGLTACVTKEQSEQGKRDEQIVEVYDAYVAYAKDNGQTPLSYEEWLKSIKGEAGVGIESIEIDENGHLIVKLTGQAKKDLGQVVFEKKYSEGLDYELSDDETGYVLTGVGICNDRKIVIPSEYNGKPVVAIAGEAFYCDGFITSVEIPDSVKTIGEGAFSDCMVLRSLTIGKGVTSIGTYAFEKNEGLSTVYYKGTVEEWANITIDSSNVSLTSATRYYYSATIPTTSGNYWHYVDGVPTKW